METYDGCQTKADGTQPVQRVSLATPERSMAFATVFREGSRNCTKPLNNPELPEPAGQSYLLNGITNSAVIPRKGWISRSASGLEAANTFTGLACWSRST
mmetsp:Transcript_110482/g.213982  ORF Transcript_110482/g.213982 Transcript_110482/m.213982 type:complete len:100 (+) Transcript_110482:386-685(+)